MNAGTASIFRDYVCARNAGRDYLVASDDVLRQPSYVKASTYARCASADGSEGILLRADRGNKFCEARVARSRMAPNRCFAGSLSFSKFASLTKKNLSADKIAWTPGAMNSST